MTEVFNTRDLDCELEMDVINQSSLNLSQHFIFKSEVVQYKTHIILYPTCSDKFVVGISGSCQFKQPEEDINKVGAYGDSEREPHDKEYVLVDNVRCQNTHAVLLLQTGWTPPVEGEPV